MSVFSESNLMDTWIQIENIYFFPFFFFFAISCLIASKIDVSGYWVDSSKP